MSIIFQLYDKFLSLTLDLGLKSNLSHINQSSLAVTIVAMGLCIKTLKFLITVLASFVVNFKETLYSHSLE